MRLNSSTQLSAMQAADQSQASMRLGTVLSAVMAPVVVALLAIWLPTGPWWWSLVWTLGLVVVAAAVGAWLYARFSSLLASREQQFRQEATPREALEGLVEQSLPIWSRHIDHSNKYVEDSVAGLMQQFGFLIDSLNRSVSASSDASGSSHVIGTINSSQADLSDAVSALRSTQDNRQQMLGELRQLRTFTTELQDMAAEVVSIADHTNLLALNAGIESARAGAAGRGFSVVATEIRGLSLRSRETATQMTDKVKAIKKSIESSVETAEGSLQKASEQLARTEERIDHVISKSRELIERLQQSSQSLREDARGVKSVIEQLIVELQFQDRVSQILGQVSRNLRELEAEINQARDPDGRIRKMDFDATAWLAKMQASYTMLDQHRATKAMPLR